MNPTTLPSRTDDVDAIVTAWHRERPDLDLAPLHVLSRVTRLARRLDQARREAFAGLGMEIWEFDVLSPYRRTGAPYRLTPGQLLDATLVTSGTMTNRVDRLSERGLVRRLPSPRDRRGVLVELTPAGAQCVDGALAALLEQERAILAVLSPHDQEQLADALRTLHTALG